MTDSQRDKPPGARKRRPRYAGRNPRQFHEKYKELDPERYPDDVQKVLQSGRTPAGMHRPIMVEEVLRVLAPKAGDIAIDCTLGGGGHAQAILQQVQPGGRLIGLDVDHIERPRTEERLRAVGFGPEVFLVRRSNFAGLPQVLAGEGISGADVILADLGVSSMQLDNPARGFTYKESGPLDMRMNPERGEPVSQLLTHVSESKLARILEENADEPRARLLARLLKAQPVHATDELRRLVLEGIASEQDGVESDDAEQSVRRVFQALRIAVNDEFSALETLLRNLPACLAPGGRVAVLSFHSGEDRRVKKAFQAGFRAGIYSAVADDAIRPTIEEVRANPRSSAAKLRWAVHQPATG